MFSALLASLESVQSEAAELDCVKEKLKVRSRG